MEEKAAAINLVSIGLAAAHSKRWLLLTAAAGLALEAAGRRSG